MSSFKAYVQLWLNGKDRSAKGGVYCPLALNNSYLLLMAQVPFLFRSTETFDRLLEVNKKLNTLQTWKGRGSRIENH